MKRQSGMLDCQIVLTFQSDSFDESCMKPKEAGDPDALFFES